MICIKFSALSPIPSVSLERKNDLTTKMALGAQRAILNTKKSTKCAFEFPPQARPIILFCQWTTASFDLPVEGSALKENKLEYFELKHMCCFRLQCASIVYFYALPSGGKSKDAVVHS